MSQVAVSDQALSAADQRFRLVFDLSYYQGQTGTALSLEDAIQHYRDTGYAAGLWPHPLFDGQYYASLADGLRPGQTALDHYIAACETEPPPPPPLQLFNADRFIWACAKIGRPVKAGTNLFLTYLTDRTSWPAGTHDLFDPAYYAGALAKAGLPARDDIPPLADYVMRTDDIAPHKLFDPAFYRMHAAARGVVLDKHPLVHHTQTNGRSGIMPHPLFSPEHYLAANPDIERSKLTR